MGDSSSRERRAAWAHGRIARAHLDARCRLRQYRFMRTSQNPVKSILVTPGQLAEWLGITVRGVEQAEDEGRLPSARRTPGNHRRWIAAELVDHLRAKGATVPPELKALIAPEAP